MDSIIEKVNKIKNAKSSMVAKRKALNALVGVGLTKNDVNLIMTQMQFTHADQIREEREARLLRQQCKAFTFGVEIECGVAHHALTTASYETGFAFEYQGYNHNDNMTKFKFVRDGSVTCENAIECVSPILNGTDGKTALKCACKTLNAAGATVNRSCGLHVHVGASDLTEEQYCNVFVNYMYLEAVIDTFMARSRRADNAYYAKGLKRYMQHILNARTRSDIFNIFANRYFKVNSYSWHRHKTIEFRQHQGTVNFDKIFNWVNFCGKLVIWSKSNRLTAEVTSIDEIPFLTAKEKAFFTARAQELV